MEGESGRRTRRVPRDTSKLMAAPAFLRRLGAAALCLAFAGLHAACSPTGPPKPAPLTLRTADGATVTGVLHTPDPRTARGRPPGLLLVPGPGRDHGVWEGFAAAAAARGYLCAAVDPRGHGVSDRAAGQRAPEGGHAALANLAAAREALVAAGADPENLAVAGEEFGATLALLYALAEPAVQAVVGVSPVLEMGGLDAERAVRDLKDCPALFVAAENDGLGAAAARALKAAAPVFSEVRLYRGTASGADLFAAHPQAMGEVFTWLEGILGAE